MSFQVIEVTDQSFEKEVLKSQKVVLLDFWAPWCGPCRAVAPKLAEIATEMGEQVTIAKINVDENPNTASEYQIRSIPTFILFKGGQKVNQLMGNLPKEHFVESLKKLL